MPNFISKHCPTFVKWCPSMKRFFYRYKAGLGDGLVAGYKNGFMEGQAQGKRDTVKDLEVAYQKRYDEESKKGEQLLEEQYQKQMVLLDKKYKDSVSLTKSKFVIDFNDEFQYEMEEKQALPKHIYESMKDIIASPQYIDVRGFFAHHVMGFYTNARKISDPANKKAMELMGDYMKDVIADMDRMKPRSEDEQAPEPADPYVL